MCGKVQDDVDFKGGDIPSNLIENVEEAQGCCEACSKRVDCGAYTFVAFAKLCYLKVRAS